MTRIAVLQMTSGIDQRANTKSVVDAIAEAAAGGAEIIFTPEMSSLLDRNRSRAATTIVSEEDDPFLAAVSAAAALHQIWVAVGSVAVQHQSIAGKCANRSLVFDRSGAIRARYDKFHMFDVDLPNGEVWRESSAYEPGQHLSVIESPIGRLGLSICYDLRFPALYQSLSNAGAQILSIPAAFTVPTGRAHWQILLQARAIENACWVVSAAQTGLHEDGRSTYGHSLVVDPWGEIVLDMGEEPGLTFCDIEISASEDALGRIPVIAHRRSIPAAERDI
jgi:deaminated glutathione amidase